MWYFSKLIKFPSISWLIIFLWSRNVQRVIEYRMLAIKQITFLLREELRMNYDVNFSVIYNLPMLQPTLLGNKLNPLTLTDAPVCGRWSVNKNSERENAEDENTRTWKTNGPINPEEKRCAQPQALLNLWTAPNVNFRNILLDFSF